MPRLDDTPIFLIGFMATGKSTVGRLVAERLGRRFVDLDERVAERAGMAVPEIFKTQGERAFRDREAATLAEVVSERGVVVACGGGTPCYGDNLARMRAGGVLVALRAQMQTVLARALAAGAADRPLLAGGADTALARAEALYREREAVYATADVTVDTDGHDVGWVADEVTRRVALRVGHVTVHLGERSYPIQVGELAQAGVLAREMFGPEVARAIVVTDENVARAGHAEAVRAALASSHFAATLIAIPPGEQFKTLAQAEQVATACVAAGLDRKSALVAVGGGVVGDLTGFVAATLYRGVPWAGVPTTLLAMVDSSIGGKTGVDMPAGKNLLGAFWQPRFVLASTSTLATLPRRELVAGLGEVLKYALLDASFGPVEALDPHRELELTVLRSAAYKASVVARDERELTGLRAVLNLGHTVGHAIEAASLTTAQPLLHGEAIALGLIAAARLSTRAGIASEPDLEARVTAACRRLDLPFELDPWLRPEVLAYIGVDKKRAGNQVSFIAIERPGQVRVVPLTLAQIEGFLRGPAAE
jgi:shikimate kinase / 3-dehydroquinate synthase